MSKKRPPRTLVERARRPIAWLLLMGGAALGCGATEKPSGSPAAPVVCPSQTTWTGTACVAASAECPQGSMWTAGRCVAVVTTPAPVADCTTPEQCETGCKGGHARHCSSLGVMVDEGNGVPRDQAKALALFRKACEAREPLACFRVGEAGKETATRASELFAIACDGGHMEGCNSLGYGYEHAEGVDRDLPRARDLYLKACEGGSRLACTNAGLVLEKGIGGAVDQAGATRAYRKACDAGRPTGCLFAGHQYDEGRGVERDLGMAATLYRRACDGGNGGGCNDLGVMHARGEGMREDARAAQSLYEKACDLENALGCVNFGRTWRDASTGDLNLGAAARWMQKGCKLGEPKGCEEARGVARLAKEACEKKPAACNNYGFILDNGFGLDKDPVQAAAMYKRGCAAGSGVSVADACGNLAESYELGTGVARDQKQALALFKKACTLGNEKACKKAEALGHDGH